MNSEFLYTNFLNTTTMLTIDSNTGSAAFLFDLRPKRKYQSVQFDDDTTTTSIHIAFEETQTVDRIVLQNMNWKNFRVYYNGATANTITLTTTCGTTTSEWDSNSSTNAYLYFDPIHMTSVTFDITETIVANSEKSIGQIYVGGKILRVARNPDVNGFKMSVKSKEISHEMSDGGTVLFKIRNKRRAQLKWRYYDSADIDELETVYDMNTAYEFAPFPTGTGWDGNFGRYAWVGGFNFLEPSNNYLPTGKDGSIDLREVPI